jgi:hypothetical protein
VPLHRAVDRKPLVVDLLGEDDDVAVIELRVSQATSAEPIFACEILSQETGVSM